MNYRIIVHKLLNFICALLPMNNEIILESHPDLTCNTWPLFQFMLKKKLNKKIRITWLVNNPEQYEKIYNNLFNISFIEIKPKGFIKRLKKYIRCNRARCIITSNRHVSKNKVGKDQVNIYLDHGSPLKDCKAIFKSINFSCDYYISQGPLFVETIMEQYDLNKTQVVCLGLPRNDELFTNKNSIEILYDDINDFNKIIIWVPTFREHKNKKRVDVDSHFPFGIPILYTENEIWQLNDYLLKRNVLLIIKPHPAQDLSVLKDFNSSNIRFLYNSDLEKYDIQTNELLAQTDAMISDYSSIYWDYLLLERPIGITLDDYEQYKEQFGFAFENPLDVLVGEFIYNTHDLITFIEQVIQNKDVNKEKRKVLLKKAQIEPVNESTKRVYEFVVKKLNEIES